MSDFASSTDRPGGGASAGANVSRASNDAARVRGKLVNRLLKGDRLFGKSHWAEPEPNASCSGARGVLPIANVDVDT